MDCDNDNGAPVSSVDVKSDLTLSGQNCGQPDASTVAKSPQQPHAGSTRRAKKIICRYALTDEPCPLGERCRYLHPRKLQQGGPSTGDASDSPGPTLASPPSASTQLPTQKEVAAAKCEPSQLRPRRSNPAKGKGKGKRQGGKDHEHPTMVSISPSQIRDLTNDTRFLARQIPSGRCETAFAVSLPMPDDFPFDVQYFYCALVVLNRYPTYKPEEDFAEIHIANKDIPARVKYNIENGFRRYVRKTVSEHMKSSAPLPTLTGYVLWLWRNLEPLANEKPAKTFEFVNFKPASESTSAVVTVPTPSDSSGSAGKEVEPKTEVPTSADNPSRDESIAARVEEKDQPHPCPVNPKGQVMAPTRPAVKRPTLKKGGRTLGLEGELAQLERRFRSSYKIVRDDDACIVVSFELKPTDPDFAIDLAFIPVELTVRKWDSAADRSPGTTGGDDALPSVELHIVDNKIVGRQGQPTTWLDRDAVSARMRHVEQEFNLHVKGISPAAHVTLLQHMNRLDRQLLSLIATPSSQQQQRQRPETSMSSSETVSGVTAAEEDSGGGSSKEQASDGRGGKEEKVNGSASEQQAEQDLRPVRRGTEIRFGSVLMEGVSMLQCHALHLLVRCDRCKNTVEVKGIQPTLPGKKDLQAWQACETCRSLVGVRFRPDYVHGGSTTLGYLDCSHCMAADLLPSKYTLMCENCPLDSDDDAGDGKGGQMTVGLLPNSRLVTNCRHCHHKMAVNLSEVEFNKLMAGLELGGKAGAGSISAQLSKLSMSKSALKHQDMAKLGVVAGQPLPENGTCKHYGKSYRWLRFPCCGKAYPCDVCHDKCEDHPNEMAKSMLCGHCAKEQSIQKAQSVGGCVACGKAYSRKAGGSGAFWEGGQGVRDQTKMSRKDTKKYQGMTKTVSSRKQKAKK
ncbi:hypothetical protein EV182_000773 [Spiromyces aspiralis]|uniref:Uncharacterized protein n=1 Tax=Spiromyces aspiralis TaxID=68401 RepID=A0ACC1HGK3_9FUNG|nr:hypothetical protein EV182_000773 [Spiromyces aspiralis]